MRPLGSASWGGVALVVSGSIWVCHFWGDRPFGRLLGNRVILVLFSRFKDMLPSA